MMPLSSRRIKICSNPPTPMPSWIRAGRSKSTCHRIGREFRFASACSICFTVTMKKRGLGRKLLELSMISLSGSQRNFRCRTALSLRISASGTPGGIMSEQHDKELLRRAVALAEEAVAGGGRPFGAVICDGEGQIVSEARSVVPHDPRDWTAHSEMQALRAASAAMTWESLGRATIYASGEPCPMCAAAIYWCNIRRLVFSVGEPAMRALRE